MKFDKIIVDVYSVAYRWAFMQEENVVKIDNKIVHLEGIIGFFNAMETYINKYGKENTEVYYLMDNMGTIYSRKEISDEYKNNRNRPPEWFYKSLDMIELILKFYRDNSYLIRIPKYEADDLVHNVLKLYCKDTDFVLMISEDSDWCRYLSPRVMQYKSHKIYDTKMYEEDFGYYPTEKSIIWDKTIYGDKADNVIPCLKEYPKTFFLSEIKKYNGINEWLMDVEQDKLKYLDLGWKLKIRKEKANILNNIKLVSAIDVSDTEIMENKINCAFKENKLKIIYTSLNLLGKMDNRISIKSTDDDIMSMLDGEPLSRQQKESLCN